MAGSVGPAAAGRERSAPICIIRVERATWKNPPRRSHGPEGCDENWPAAVPRLRDRLCINLDMRPPRVRPLPDRRLILIATKAALFMGQDTSLFFKKGLLLPAMHF
jgi:hypothetical protein